MGLERQNPGGLTPTHAQTRRWNEVEASHRLRALKFRLNKGHVTLHWDFAPAPLAQENIDGGLIGGAALKANAFSGMIEAAIELSS